MRDVTAHDTPAGRPLRVQRKCNCATSGGTCESCQRDRDRQSVQRQAMSGASHDPLEAEADRAAQRVVDEPGRAAPSVASRPGAVPATPQPASVQRVGAQSGSPLDGGVRQQMERRFGHDFSHVRVHADGDAARSAQDIGATAYTTGAHVVFGAGAYAPHSRDGQRLIAHELTHVLQQTGGTPAVQRQPAPAASKQDVAIVLSDDEKDMAEGAAYGTGVPPIRVTSVEDAVNKLKALGVPVGRLYVISHSNAEGQLQFSSGAGTTSMVDVDVLAKALKGAVSIDTVDFRGCKLGAAAGKMDKFRQTVGAQSVKSSNCWTFTQRLKPITVSGVPLTRQDQIPKGQEAEVDRVLLQNINGMQADGGQPVGRCLIGLARGESPGSKTLKKIWGLYWANQGQLVASWASPDYNATWQTGSICSKDMTAATKPCGIVESKEAPQSAPAGDKKSGALDAAPAPDLQDPDRQEAV